MSRRGYVYLICNPQTNAFKIGVTTGSIESRIKKLQTGNDCELHIVAWHESTRPFKIEKLLHRKCYGEHKLNEWFELTDEEVFGFRDECEKMERMLDSISDNPYLRL